jgi:membrane-bound inhibitor of C-type lysozyme
MHNRSLLFGTFAVLLVLVVGLFWYFEVEAPEGTQIMPEIVATSTFSCAEGKTITAGFSLQGIAEVELSDGRKFTLEQTASQTGVRYANEGEEIVFFTEKDDAYVKERGVETYRDCLQQSSTLEDTAGKEPLVSSPPVRSYDLALKKIVGNWGNLESPGRIFKIKPGFAFQESRLVKDGEFMVPQGTWKLEQVFGTPKTFDLSNVPRGTLLFTRVSDKGEATVYEVRTISDTALTLYEIERGVIFSFSRR